MEVQTRRLTTTSNMIGEFISHFASVIGFIKYFSSKFDQSNVSELFLFALLKVFDVHLGENQNFDHHLLMKMSRIRGSTTVFSPETIQLQT